MRKPATPSERGLTATDRRRLVRALAEAKEARLSRRLQAVLLVAEGHPPAEAAHLTGLSRRAVYHMVKSYAGSVFEVESLYSSTIIIALRTGASSLEISGNA
jgi:hypothetical protein